MKRQVNGGKGNQVPEILRQWAGDQKVDYFFRLHISPEVQLENLWYGTGCENRIGFTFEDLKYPYLWEQIVFRQDLPVTRDFTHLLLSGQSAEVELRVIAKSGETCWLKIRGYPDVATTEKATTSIWGTATDITQQKRMNLCVQGAEANYQGLFERSRDAILLLDEKTGIITRANLASRKIFANSGMEIVGQHYSKILPKECEELVSLSGPVIPQGDRRINISKPDGTKIPVLVNASPLEINGQALIQVTCNDLTLPLSHEERQLSPLEDTKEPEHLLYETLSNVAHELRIPLSVIKGGTTLLLGYNSRLREEDKIKCVESIDNGADRLASLIERLFSVSQLDMGMMKINKLPTDIRALLQQVVAEMQLRFRNHTIKLELPQKLSQVDLDKTGICQVMNNIIENAAKYSDPKSEITVSAQIREKMILIAVSDNGIGIPSQERRLVFDRLYRGSRAKAWGKGSGMGLGLTLCRKLVEEHGGRIWIEGKSGPGTSCVFNLPLVAKTVLKKVPA